MPLFPYRSPAPCYRTNKIDKYPAHIRRLAFDLFSHAHGFMPAAFANDHCVQREGSFSIIATTSDETSAKIVMYDSAVGEWLERNDPGWSDGTCVWVRANDVSGRVFEDAAHDPAFVHNWALTRFVPNEALSVAPNPNEHFYYFKIHPGESRAPIAELLAFCSTL
jgi:hypothetical protein